MQSLGAAALLPAIPVQPFAVTAIASSTAAPAFSAHTYQWAEMIVRAHNKCNIGLLRRSLHIDATVAEALKSSLIRNGVVHAHANAYGIHKATAPLYEGAFMNVSDTVKNAANEVLDILGEENPDDAPSSQNSPENDSVSSDLRDFPDSARESAEIPDMTQNKADQIDEIES